MKWINKYFPIKAGSFSEFEKYVREHSGSVVVAEPIIALEGLGSGYPGFSVASCKIKFESKTQRGRPIVFNDYYGSKIGLKEKAEGVLRTFLTAEAKLNQLKKDLPNIETKLLAAGKEISNEDYAVLCKKAKELNLTSF